MYQLLDVVCAFLVLGYLGYAVAVPDVCGNNSDMKFVADPVNCSVMYMCFNGQQFKYNCPQNTVAGVEAKTCVPKGSPQDKCSKKNETSSICKNGSDVIYADKENCARYFTCPSGITGSDVKPELKECSYPLLYDEDLKSCQHPVTKVKCGTRPEPKDACDYQANQCLTAHCTPCEVRFPSCKGLSNGMNSWRGREESPYFVICDNERVVYSDACRATEKGQQIFSSKKNTCVEL